MTRPRQVVLVVGPSRAGVTSLVAALRERMPEQSIVEAGDGGAGDSPAVVVAVVSAVAPMTESDCATVDMVAAGVDAVVGVVAKIDAHRGWRDVLTANRLALGAHASRYRTMPWVGVAAAPDVGDPNVDELVPALRDVLSRPELDRRNRLCMNSSRDRHARTARVGRLRERRVALVRQRRSVRTERMTALRGGLHRERARLGQFVRRRCAGLRTEFRVAAAEVSRGGAHRLEAALVSEFEDFLGELGERIETGLDDLAATLGVAPPKTAGSVTPELAGPPMASTRTERRLTVALGAGFGLGVAMAVSRLLAGLAPGFTVAAVAVGGLAGCALTAWLVMTRGLLHRRAVLDRWVSETVAAFRAHAEDVIAGALLTAEAGFTAELGALDDAEASALAPHLGAIDDEIRRLTLGAGGEGREAERATLRRRETGW